MASVHGAGNRPAGGKSPAQLKQEAIKAANKEAAAAASKRMRSI